MKKFLFVVLIIVFSFSITGNFIQSKDKDKEKYAPEEIVIGYKENANMEEASSRVRNEHALEQLEVGYKGNFEVVKIPKNKTIEELLPKIKEDKDVAYAEYNFIAYTCSEPVNDEFFQPYQWNFYDYGKLSKSVASDYGVQATLAWPTTTGSGVKVAIVDTGVAYENYSKFQKAPDLGNNFDTTNAKNYTGRKPTSHANDDNGHGTHVCGTIAQSTNNTIGCAGIAYNATILPIKVLTSSGAGTYAAIANGIRWAADHGAKIINLSLGGTADASTLKDACQYAFNQGVLLVCAAGNDGDGKNEPLYPAAYNDYCLAVGATNFNGAKTSYSNYGSYVDIVAPGGDTNDFNKDGIIDGIVQQTFTKLNKFGYYLFTGTSMATPHVAAIAALILEDNNYTNAQVTQALIETTKNHPTERNDQTGWGLVNAYGAINW